MMMMSLSLSFWREKNLEQKSKGLGYQSRRRGKDTRDSFKARTRHHFEDQEGVEEEEEEEEEGNERDTREDEVCLCLCLRGETPTKSGNEGASKRD